MSYSDEQLLPLSALQHLLFCERQCALIHIEQIWQENYFTARGRILHERVDTGGNRVLGQDIKVEYGVPLRSYRLGLIGKADVVEFHLKITESGEKWIPFPVEYKRGRNKKNDCDRVQLCAQAICLEEQLNIKIPRGALFYGKTRRRENVFFNEKLKNETIEAALKLHELISSGITPLPVYSSACKSCSLKDFCLPKYAGRKNLVVSYITKMLDKINHEETT